MKRRGLIICVAMVIAISVVTMAFSAWQFDAGQKYPQDVKVNYDDIEENYSFTEAAIRNNIAKEYTIYLFPSTLYLNDYIDYLDGKTTVKPEELYGNIQPMTDSEGDVMYVGGKVAGYETNYSSIANSTAQGDSLRQLYSTAACGGDGGYIGNLIGSAYGYEDLYLTADGTADYQTEYDEYYTSTSGSTNNTNAESRQYWEGNLEYLDSDGNSRQVLKRYIGSYEGDVSDQYRAGQFNQRKFNYRNQHRYDRFGGWRSIEYGQGRYLPLKITVGSDFAYSDFANLVLSSLTSMPSEDKLGSMNLTFTQWAYVDTKHTSSYDDGDGGTVNLNYTLPFYANYSNTQAVEASGSSRAFSQEQLRVRNAYLNYTIEQYFDIMKDFENYSDEYGVIRLFPTFSCGSNYAQSSDFIIDITQPNNAEVWNNGVSRGVGDGIFMYTAYSNGNSTMGNDLDGEPLRDFRLYTTMTTQSVSYYDNLYGAMSNKYEAQVGGIRCSMYANLNIDSINKLEIWLNPKAGATETWEQDNLLLYDISSDVISNIIDAYGDGLYNLYLFVGNYGLNNLPDDLQSISNIVEYARTADNIFPDFTGKNLISLESFGTKSLASFGAGTTYDDMSIYKDNPSIGSYSVAWPNGLSGIDNDWCQFLGAKGLANKGSATERKFYRPVMLAIEKVIDARVLNNLTIDETSANDVNQMLDAYDRDGKAFSLIGENMYIADLGSSQVNMSLRPLNEQYPYSYYISGVDFTNSATDYFQIRFQQRYRADLPIAGTDGTAGVDTESQGGLAPALNVVYSPDADGTFDEDRRFVNAFGKDGYFDAVSVNMENYVSPSEATQIFFKLKSEEQRGIYDLIIMYVPYTFWSVTSTVARDGDVQDVTRIYFTEQEADAALGGNAAKYSHRPGFYVFAYRHTNIFIKVVEKDPWQTYVSDGAQFVKHSDYSNNRLLFQSVFQLGITLGTSYGTQVQGQGSSDINLVDYQQPGYNASFGKCINTYIAAYLKGNPNVNIDKIVLRDHVTKGIIGYYQKVSGTASGDDIIAVDGQNWQLTLEELVVRKNYIFYIDTV